MNRKRRKGAVLVLFGAVALASATRLHGAPASFALGVACALVILGVFILFTSKTEESSG